MIYGIGTDIVAVGRCEDMLRRRGDRALEMILHPQEYALCLQRYGVIPDARHARFLAKRFAAKEAFVKALRTGFTGGVTMRDIAALPDEHGAPVLALSGNTKIVTSRRCGEEALLHVSLSDEKEYATAYVIIEKCL